MMIFTPVTVLSYVNKLYVELPHYSEKEKLWLLANRILEDNELAQDAVKITFE